MYFNEKDIAYLRIKELYDVVDYFVINEATKTHQGQDKELSFWKDTRLEQFKDKIVYSPIELDGRFDVLMPKFFPEAKITILVRKGNESLYQEHPFLTQTLVWNKQDGKYKSLFRLLKVIRQKQFDTVINLHRFASSGFLTAFSKARYTSGYDKNPFSFLFDNKSKHKNYNSPLL
jgi:hypothetical protein